jgi:hypothetical protein
MKRGLRQGLRQGWRQELRNKYGWLGLGLVVAIVLAIGTPVFQGVLPSPTPLVLAQSESAPDSSPAPDAPPASPVSPLPLPSVPLSPPARPAQLPPPPAPPTPLPASTAAPLPLAGEYRDPSGRFKVGLLQNYQVSPIAGSVLVESAEGDLAYSVVVQTQPVTSPIGLLPGVNAEALAQVAGMVFQRGEDFQPGLPQPEAGGGAVINWTGNLTIAGKAQTVGGVVLVRPNSKTVLLLMIAATQSGGDRVQGALAALANTMQPL